MLYKNMFFFNLNSKKWFYFKYPLYIVQVAPYNKISK